MKQISFKFHTVNDLSLTLRLIPEQGMLITHVEQYKNWYTNPNGWVVRFGTTKTGLDWTGQVGTLSTPLLAVSNVFTR